MEVEFDLHFDRGQAFLGEVERRGKSSLNRVNTLNKSFGKEDVGCVNEQPLVGSIWYL